MEKEKKSIHFIAIGGSLMHSLAIAVKQAGHKVTGSDDEIYDPSKSNLEKHGLLPEKWGWDASQITADLDEIVLGMHARNDNPELIKAQEVGLKILSAPEYIYEQSRNKQRIVIAGSHGKSTITSIMIHVLKFHGREFDFAVGAQVPGFDNMVKLTDAPIIVIEGDEYPSSPLDSKPKIMNYHHHIGLISGIAWDHANVFPTEDDYVKQFDFFADATPKAGTLVYCEEDPIADVIGSKSREDVFQLEYQNHPFEIENGKTYLLNNDQRIPVNIFGRHNMLNIAGAKRALEKVSISAEDFYLAIASFFGADRRLEIVTENESTTVFKDFAHSPSKVTAATLAVKEQYPDRDLVAIVELHTYSSLNLNFLPSYNGALKYANNPAVYFNPKTIENKNLSPISENEIKGAFSNQNLKIFNDTEQMNNWLQDQNWNNKNLLLMSSGTFDELDIEALSREITA